MLSRTPRNSAQVGWPDALARWISTVTNPIFMAMPLALAVSWREAESWRAALSWACIYLVLTDFAPMALMALEARRGRVNDLHRARGRERLKPLLMSLPWIAAAWILFTLLPAPPLLQRLVAVQLLQVGVMTAITRFWQISFHGAAVGGLATIALIVYGVQMWPLLLLVPVVGWSQVHRQRHTAAQMAAGVSLAAIVYGVGFGTI